VLRHKSRYPSRRFYCRVAAKHKAMEPHNRSTGTDVVASLTLHTALYPSHKTTATLSMPGSKQDFKQDFRDDGVQKTTKNTQELLQGLQDGQNQIIRQMQDLLLSLRELVVAQKESNGFVPRRVEELCGTNRVPTSHGHAGRRLASVPELLEMVLLWLPAKNILFARCVSVFFDSTITKSGPLQEKLFFRRNSNFSPLNHAALNPILTGKSVLEQLPLYFDPGTIRLAYCYSQGRRRISCRSATVSTDEKTGQASILLVFKDSPPFNTLEADERRTFDSGSWKRMYLSQPPCDVHWRFTVELGRVQQVYSGATSGEHHMDTLLEALAASVPKCSEERIRNRRT
jgi:hypothetical protein